MKIIKSPETACEQYKSVKSYMLLSEINLSVTRSKILYRVPWMCYKERFHPFLKTKLDGTGVLLF